MSNQEPSNYHITQQEQELLDLISDAVAIKDIDNRIVFWNRASEERYGWKREEIIGKLGHEILQTEFPIPYEQIQKQLLENGKWHGEIIHTCSNGKKITVATRRALRTDNENKPAFIVEISLDITKLVEENKQANQWKVLGQLASGVAHEVRNPLNSISALMESLLRELDGSPTVQPYIYHIKKQTKRLADLMSDLLELGKASKIEERSLVYLSDILRDTHNLFASQPENAKRITFEICDELTRTPINGVSRRLQQVFINLIENALQHSPSHAPVTVSAALKHKYLVQVSIRDYGKGIPLEMIDRVFEPFYSTRKTGTGLGLCIVRQIIETHNGTIKIRNNTPDPGVTVDIMLPVSSAI